MNSELPPDAPSANPNPPNLSASVERRKLVERGPNKVWLLGVAFGIALLLATALLLVGLGKL